MFTIRRSPRYLPAVRQFCFSATKLEGKRDNHPLNVDPRSKVNADGTKYAKQIDEIFRKLELQDENSPNVKPFQPRTGLYAEMKDKDDASQSSAPKDTASLFSQLDQATENWLGTNQLPLSEVQTIEYPELYSMIRSSWPSGTYLIDVREKEEFAKGFIPGAINIPLSKIHEFFLLEGALFFDAFRFKKPSYFDNLIFYCRSGKRSQKAAEMAVEEKYQKVSNYKGSWLEWSGKQQEETA